MRILLIQPKMNRRPMDTALKTRMAPSLALLTLMKLTPPGHEVVIINENVSKVDFDQAADLVGLTVTLDVMPRAAAIAQRFRARGILVVAGGIHVTCCPDSCLDSFDAICVGPAERIWARLIRDAAANTLARVYQDCDHFQGSEIASPAYEAVHGQQYLYTNVVTTSRGCPHQCDFCYNSCQHHMYTKRPIADVLRDIKTLGTRHILFVDDNFIGTPSHTEALLAAIRPLNLIWSAAVTTQILNMPHLLDLMADTGCQSLFIGFESINSASLRSVHKNNQVALYAQLVAAIHQRGMMVNASMVFGLDSDDPGTFRRTLDWLVALKVETLTSHILTPYPGTSLHRKLEEQGRIIDHDLSKYNTAHVVFQPLLMTKQELYDGYLWIYRKFYSFANIMRRYPVHQKQRKAYLLFNLLYRKFGRFSSLLARMIPMQLLGRFAAWLSYKA